MEFFRQIWEQFSSLLKWWVLVHPWEQGIRVWLGSKTKLIGPGIHFRVPHLHTVYVQTVRLNFIMTPPQTLTTRCGSTLTISTIVGYSITDILKVYNSVSELTGAIASLIMGSVSSFVNNNAIEDCSPDRIEQHINNILTDTKWGISIKEVGVCTYAVVKTFRFIQDHQWMDTSKTLDKSR